MNYRIVIVISVVLYARLLQVNEELSKFSFQPPWVGSGSVSLSGADVSNMCRHVIFGIHSRHSFLKFQASTPYQKLELPESRVRSAISTLNHGCILPIPSLQLQKKPVKGREAEGLVTELWSPRFVTIQ